MVRFFEESLASGFVLVGHRNDDVTVVSRALTANDDLVTVHDANVDHTFTANRQHKQIAAE